MVYKVVFLLVLFGVASSKLPERRTCDPEPRERSPTFCSNYRNIEYLNDMLTKLKEKQKMLEEKIEDIAKVEARLDAVETKFEAQLKKLQNDSKGVPQIAFSASLVNSGHIYRGPSSDKTLVYKRIFSNTGGGYDQNTGIFTAPVKGLYYFSFSTFGYNTHTTGAILVKNGVNQISTFDCATSDRSDSGSNSAILQLDKDDQVNMKLWHNGRVYDNLNGHTTFSGFLVFPL